MPIPHISDTIHLTDPSAGNAGAGNGGDGYSLSGIYYNPVATVASSQVTTGASPDIHNGDHVFQLAGWDAGGGGNGGGSGTTTLNAGGFSTHTGGAGGDATSNGSLGSQSGGDTAAVSAATTATQFTEFVADQHATILSGVGGNGGDGNMAEGGSISNALVHTDPLTTYESNAFTDVGFALSHLDLSI